MKNKILLALLTAFTTGLNAQTWSGATPGNIYYNFGNVGVGTTNPMSRFQIHADNDNSNALRLDVGKFSMGGSAKFSIDAVGIVDGRFVVKENGNVGIGVPSPSAKLQINADNENNNALRLEVGRFSMNGEGRFSVDASGVQDGRFVVKENGNVGIGTPNPGSKLTVAGDINSREVRVTINAGSDFVFQDGYALRTLNEVEQFINENRHLPDIEAAKEMEEKGIELGKMDMKLLQKIEELTLYMIDFKKEMDELLEENQKLKDRITQLEKN